MKYLHDMKYGSELLNMFCFVCCLLILININFNSNFFSFVYVQTYLALFFEKHSIAKDDIYFFFWI